MRGWSSFLASDLVFAPGSTGTSSAGFMVSISVLRTGSGEISCLKQSYRLNPQDFNDSGRIHQKGIACR